MSYSSMFGSHFQPTRRWAPQVEVSNDSVGQVVPEELRVDPYLPAIGADPFDPAGAIVIPSGRFVSIGFARAVGAGGNYRFARTDTGKTTLTIHDGVNLTPAGLAVNQMYKNQDDFMMTSPTVKYRKGFVAEVPYMSSINESYGTLYAGDRLTGYYGSTTSTTSQAFLHKGKPVKWLARRLYVISTTSSSIVNLSAAIYPAFQPRIVGAFASGTLGTPTATLSWTGSVWQVSFTGTGSAVTEVWYEFGQDADQVAGEVVRIQSLSDVLSRDDFLRWAEYAPNDYLNYPPAAQRVAVTQVTTETPTTVTTNAAYRVLNYPIDVHYTVLVEVSNVILTDINGVQSTYTGSGASSSWFPLPTTNLTDARQYFSGLYHNVNWRTGLIELGSNVAVADTNVNGGAIRIRVTYSYITDPREGAVLWGAGIINLTDGRQTNQSLVNQGRGLPSHLNLPDVVAAMRMVVY